MKSHFENETKQYNELYEETRPPSNVIVFKNYKTAKPVRSKEEEYPALEFRIDVINHSYYNFKPERVLLKCWNDAKNNGEDEWKAGMKTAGLGYSGFHGYINIGPELPAYGESYIIFKVPIKEAYKDLERWDLEGRVEYVSEEKTEFPEIDLRFYLTKHAEEDLEQKLNKALGGEK